MDVNFLDILLIYLGRHTACANSYDLLNLGLNHDYWYISYKDVTLIS